MINKLLMAEEKNVSMGEIIRRIKKLRNDKKVQEYIEMRDALWGKLELATLAWARTQTLNKGLREDE
ncbi:hypothetical protein ES703_123451 [subsurface metagenome]